LISFRYHLVSIVAVFLALGLGILAGTTVINQRVVHNLRQRTSAAEEQANASQQQLALLDSFATLAAPELIDGKLTGREVVLIKDDRTDGSTVGAARDSLVDAGATVTAVLSVTTKMAADDPSTRQDLAGALGTAGSSIDLTQEAATAVADRLASGGAVAPPGKSGPSDLLSGLLSKGFLDPSDGPQISSADLPTIGGGPVIVLGGGAADPAVPFGAFLVPLVERLVADRANVAVAEATQVTHSLVEQVRSDPNLSGDDRMVTVDDLDGSTLFGGVGLVLGLRDLIGTETGGDYGVKDGAASLIPQP
jgi:pyrimidine operon attenuation protein/uracil phosphoribosyltransferase